jgi:hypothetical protein
MSRRWRAREQYHQRLAVLSEIDTAARAETYLAIRVALRASTSRMMMLESAFGP